MDLRRPFAPFAKARSPVASIALLLASVPLAASAQQSLHYMLTPIPVLQQRNYTIATGVNSLGHVTGASGNQSYVSDGVGVRGFGRDGRGPSTAYALNAHDDVAGTDDTMQVAGAPHAYMIQGRKRTYLYDEGNRGTRAFAINNPGTVAGEAFVGSETHPVVWRDGRVIDLAPLMPPSALAVAYGINDDDDVVVVASALGVAQSYVVRPGHDATPIDVFGSTLVSASDINNRGLVCGNFSTNATGDLHGFLWKDGHAIDGGASLEDKSSFLDAVNDDGVAVGAAYSKTTFEYWAVVYSNGQVVDLNTVTDNLAGWKLEEATAISDSGLIVGNGTIHGHTRPFLLTPVPE